VCRYDHSLGGDIGGLMTRAKRAQVTDLKAHRRVRYHERGTYINRQIIEGQVVTMVLVLLAAYRFMSEKAPDTRRRYPWNGRRLRAKSSAGLYLRRSYGDPRRSTGFPGVRSPPKEQDTACVVLYSTVL
jgi:hypothetical protein